MKHTILALVSLLATTPMMAQYAWQYDAHPGKLDLGEGIRYRVETQGSFSKDKTPLWLNANKHGLSSLDETNGYVRATAIRPLLNDSSRRWGMASMWPPRFITPATWWCSRRLLRAVGFMAH